MNPTAEQQQIIDENSHLVVLAKPGSGKTFTLSKIIQKQLRLLEDFRGVVAISYTKKASKELEVRSLQGGFDAGNSFFGTIDNFIIREIVIPFLRHSLLESSGEVDILKFDLVKKKIACPSKYKDEFQSQSNVFSSYFINESLTLLKLGILVLEACPKLALHVIETSEDCRNYLRSKYTHIIIDEYQDSGWEQHDIFLKLKKLGLTAIAVGDPDQSIYHFSKKDSKHLVSLISNPDFKTFQLQTNHRSHPNIINYSLSFMADNPVLLAQDEERVWLRGIGGNEYDIALWIKKCVEAMEKKGDLLQRSDLAILCRNNSTAAIIKSSIGIDAKYSQDTPLDRDGEVWSVIFRELLFTLHNNDRDVMSFCQTYINEFHNQVRFRKLYCKVSCLKKRFLDEGVGGLSCVDFHSIAEMISPQKINPSSLKLLNEVLVNPDYFNSYRPTLASEVQIMTLHKSKGLEFNTVIHLDLFDDVLPTEDAIKGNDVEMIQSRNLHYVGITRAKDRLILLISKFRMASSGNFILAEPSRFLDEKNLKSLRK